MLAVTHLVIALIIIKLLGLDRSAALLTMLFGVFIDLDHLLALPQFVMEARAQGVTDINTAMHLPMQWKSAIHDPSAILIVAPCSAFARLSAPLIAWTAHILLDYIQITYLGPASLVEILFLLSLLGLFLAIEKRALEKDREKVTFAGLIGFEIEGVTKWFGGITLAIKSSPLRGLLRERGYTSQ